MVGVLIPGFRNPPTPFRPTDVVPSSLGGKAVGAPIALGTSWYVRVGGSNDNGGSSTSLTAERTGTDGSLTSGSATFTSASGAFTSADVGKGLCVNTGANARRYKIIAVVDSTHVTLDRNAGNNLNTQTWALGGAWADIRPALGDIAVTFNGNNAGPAIAAGDTVYIGAGTYRAIYSVGAGTWTQPIGEVKFVGDIYGAYTGDTAGPVILTGYTTDDKTAPTSSSLLNLNGKSNLTFQNIFFMGGTGAVIQASTATSQNITIRDCVIFTSPSAAGAGILATAAYGMPFNWTVERCWVHKSSANCFQITGTTGNATDFDLNFNINNCMFLGGAGSSASVNFTTSGTLAGHPGGVRVRNCFHIGSSSILVTGSSAVSTQIPSTCTGSIVICGSSPAQNATNSGQIVEDYNIFYGSSAVRFNVSAGAHTIADGSYSPMFYFGQERIWNAMPRIFGEPMSGSSWLAFGAIDTQVGLDIRKADRPSSAAKWDVGPFQRGNNFSKETATVNSGTNAISVIGQGFEDFDIFVDAGQVTVNVYCRYDSNYVGPLPSLRVVNGGEVGVGDVIAMASVLSLNAFAQISVTINPTRSGIVTVRMQASDTSNAGKTIFDSFSTS